MENKTQKNPCLHNSIKGYSLLAERALSEVG